MRHGVDRCVSMHIALPRAHTRSREAKRKKPESTVVPVVFSDQPSTPGVTDMRCAPPSYPWPAPLMKQSDDVPHNLRAGAVELEAQPSGLDTSLPEPAYLKSPHCA